MTKICQRSSCWAADRAAYRRHEFFVKTVQKVVDVTVKAGSWLHTDSASSYAMQDGVRVVAIGIL
jgi:hypothetical protein